jgi:hypothetical protein
MVYRDRQRGSSTVGAGWLAAGLVVPEGCECLSQPRSRAVQPEDPDRPARPPPRGAIAPAPLGPGASGALVAMATSSRPAKPTSRGDRLTGVPGVCPRCRTWPIATCRNPTTTFVQVKVPCPGRGCVAERHSNTGTLIMKEPTGGGMPVAPPAVRPRRLQLVVNGRLSEAGHMLIFGSYARPCVIVGALSVRRRSGVRWTPVNGQRVSARNEQADSTHGEAPANAEVA